MTDIDEITKLSHENSFKLGYTLFWGLHNGEICKIDDDEKEITPIGKDAQERFVWWWWDDESLRINGEENRLRYKIYNDNIRFFELFFSNSIPPKVRYEIYTSLIKAYDKRFHDLIKSFLLKNIYYYKRRHEKKIHEKCLDEIERLTLEELNR